MIEKKMPAAPSQCGMPSFHYDDYVVIHTGSGVLHSRSLRNQHAAVKHVRLLLVTMNPSEVLNHQIMTSQNNGSVLPLLLIHVMAPDTRQCRIITQCKLVMGYNP